MNYKQEIEKYIPYNEQEEKDRELMLEYIRLFPNILTRDCKIGHFSASGFIVNQKRDNVLMIYHNIYQSWAWTGGHADGEEELLQVALREVQEETGVTKVTPVQEKAISLEILPVPGHIKRGEFVSSHQHLNITYLLEVSEEERLQIKEDENSGVRWIPMDLIQDYVTENHMHPIYQKIIEKIRRE